MKGSSTKCGTTTCSKSKHQNPELQFHPFPADPVRCKQWVQNCGRADLQDKRAQYLHRNAKLCSLHFEASHFFKNDNTQHLLPSAVPTIFAVPSQPPQVTTKQTPHQQPGSLANKTRTDAVSETHGVRAEVGSEASEASVYILPDDPPFIKIESDALPAVNEQPFFHCYAPNPIKDERFDAESEPDIKPFVEVEPFFNRNVSTSAEDARWSRAVPVAQPLDGSSPDIVQCTEYFKRCSPSLCERSAVAKDEVPGSGDLDGVATDVGSSEQCLRCGATSLARECGSSDMVVAHHSSHTRDEQPASASDGRSTAPEGRGTTRLRADVSDKPHRCDICRALFDSASDGRSTAPEGRGTTRLPADVSDKPHRCDICRALFDSKLHLMQHWLTHADVKLDRMPLERRSDVPSRSRIRTGDEPYLCGRCGKTYRKVCYLEKHQCANAADKPHKCGTCGRMFRKKCRLALHYRTRIDDLHCKCDACARKVHGKRVQCLHSTDRP